MLRHDCRLAPHGRLLIHNRHHAKYSDLYVRSADTVAPAVHCRNSRNVRLRRLLIEHHAGGAGIVFDKCDNISIEEVVVVAVHAGDSPGSEADGARPGPCPGGGRSVRECDNIHGLDSRGVVIRRARVLGGATGIELHRCPGVQLRHISARNVRGPYPRGQCVQFSQCDGASLSNFFCHNEPNRSWPEDSISVWRSAGVSVREGLVDGNNAPNGVGIMFENDKAGATGGLIEDVDAVHMGGGCFSGYPARKLRMVRVRCGWNHCGGWGGRQPPSSGGQMWAAGRAQNGLSSVGVTIDAAQFWSPCNPRKAPHWQPEGGAQNAYARLDIREAVFTPRRPAARNMRMCWEKLPAGKVAGSPAGDPRVVNSANDEALNRGGRGRARSTSSAARERRAQTSATSSPVVSPLFSDSS